MSDLLSSPITNKSTLYSAFAAGVLAAPGVVPPRPTDEAGREAWCEEVRALFDDLEYLVGARELSEDVLAIINDPAFEDRKDKKKILSGRVIAVSTLGGNLSVLALQNGWGREIDVAEAQEVWEEHFRETGAHERDNGLLRNTYGIERFFLPDATTTAGTRMVRACKGLVGKHVRVWKEVQQYTGKDNEERDKRVAVHIEELPTEFTFRKRKAKKSSDSDSDNIASEPFPETPSEGISVEEWADFVLDMEVNHPEVDVDHLIARCAKSMSTPEPEWSEAQRQRARKSIEKAAQRTTA